MKPISITSFASISALGSTSENIWTAYTNDLTYITQSAIGAQTVWSGKIPERSFDEIENLRHSDSKYRNLDDSVLFAIYTSRKAIEMSNWKPHDHFGVNIGSSRGATTLFEKYHKEFLTTGNSSTLSSPTTTLGNISSWVAHDLQTKGPEISHSITCSTALHSVLNGIAWINSGMSEKFLVGGSEAPLTDFTITQMQALKVYSKEDSPYPCRALDLAKTRNTMVLGEGASVICMEKGITANALAQIEGIGYATELLKHNTSVTTDAECFQKSMAMATKGVNLNDIDAIIMHAPGTIKGDTSEMNAIKKLFKDNIPFVTTNKWKIGHTFGASGLLSFELGLFMLEKQHAIKVPFTPEQDYPKKIRKVLINAVGFGGNAVTVLISK